MFVRVSLLLLLVDGIDVCSSLCEYYYDRTPINRRDYLIPDYGTYNSALSTLAIDIPSLLFTSDSCWPADSSSGLFLRLVWHVVGTFRDTEGESGAARATIGGIKEKYGVIFAFAGTAAILQDGGPVGQVYVLVVLKIQTVHYEVHKLDQFIIPVEQQVFGRMDDAARDGASDIE